MNESLDLKYRPKRFSEVLGQDAIVQALKNSLKSKSTTPFLFTGLSGGGKTTLARIYARAKVCENLQADMEPCNECATCLSHLDRALTSFQEINGAKVTQVDAFRELLDGLVYKPVDSEFHVLLVDECHQLSKASQNLLLKPLEEPLENVVVLLCTTEPAKLIPTVRGRCIEFNVSRTPDKAIVERLTYICEQEGLQYEPFALATIAKNKRGHIRNAIKELERLSAFGAITAEVTRQHFAFDVKTAYFDVLLNLKENPAESLRVAETILSQVNPNDFVAGMIEACLLSTKSKLNVNHDVAELDAEKARVTYGALNGQLLEISDHLIGLTRVTDTHSILCSLLVINQKLNRKWAEPAPVQASAQPPVAASLPEPKSEPTEKKVTIPQRVPMNLLPPITSVDSVARSRKPQNPITGKQETPADPVISPTSPTSDPIYTHEQAAHAFTGRRFNGNF